MKNIFNFWNISAEPFLLVFILSVLWFRLSDHAKGGFLYFFSLLLLFFIEISPLHFLGMHYLLSAYMAVHITVLLICGPLICRAFHLNKTQHAIIEKITHFLNRNIWISWLCGIGIMWFWHIPIVFDRVFPKEHTLFSFHWLSFLHTFTLLLGGIFFSWPIVGPESRTPLHPLVGVAYLFTACVGCSVLGLLLTFAPPTLYHHYAAADFYGWSTIIRQQWGISRALDQQAAGLMMWVPCCFIYLSGALYLIYKWLTEPSKSHSIILNQPRYEQ